MLLLLGYISNSQRDLQNWFVTITYAGEYK